MHQKFHITRSFLPVNSNVTEMQQDLYTLENASQLYDEDCIKPTPFAFKRMRGFLANTFLVTNNFPFGTIYPDQSGGLRVDWVHADKELRLIVPSVENMRQYIWYMSGTDHGLVDNVSALKLGELLNWLTNDKSKSTG